MSERCRRGAVPSPPPAGSIDAQILATWHALLVNPDLDPIHALHAIDQFLDRRAGPAVGQAAFASPLNHPLPADTLAQHSVIAGVLAILLCGLASDTAAARGPRTQETRTAPKPGPVQHRPGCSLPPRPRTLSADTSYAGIDDASHLTRTLQTPVRDAAV